jgi:putative transposase
MLKKVTIEAALNAELAGHLGLDKHQPNTNTNKNSRNGMSSKSVHTDDGTVEIEVPHDLDSSFEPELVKKTTNVT